MSVIEALVCELAEFALNAAEIEHHFREVPYPTLADLMKETGVAYQWALARAPYATRAGQTLHWATT